jgi:hypothetical protein
MNTIELSDIKDTKKLEHNGKCLQILSWFYLNKNFCVKGTGDCEAKLVVILENGIKLEGDELNSAKNC